jgi:hypothetical protein
MFPSDEVAESKMSTAQTESTSLTSPAIVATTTVAPTSQDSTKDAGRVRIGGGMMHFTKDTGRVRIGGGMMRF